MTTQDYVNLYNEGKLPLTNLNTFIEKLLLEREDSTPIASEVLPRFGGLNAYDVFNQKEVYNGHGQLEITYMTIDEVYGLIGQLEDNAKLTKNPLDDIFCLQLYKESGKYTGSIYQQTTPPTMWLTIEEINLDA